MSLIHSQLGADELVSRLKDARARLRALAALLHGRDWIGHRGPTVNPPLWEYGHIAWFQELWCLRLKPGREPSESPLLQPLQPSFCPWADWLFDSSRIPHDARWHAPLPPPHETANYAEQVLAAAVERIRSERSDALSYYAELSLYHELMHVEAWWMMWQQHAFRPPTMPSLPRFDDEAVLNVPGGSIVLGTRPEAGFAFDNEKGVHEQDLAAFRIDAHPVTCGQFAAFVDDDGYSRAELWTGAGAEWRAASGSRHPLYWRFAGGSWQTRRFDRWIPLPAVEPVIHINRHEAQAYCRWRGCALPSAAQWLKASAMPGFERGRCWEWTRDAFLPYPGFAPGPYSDYSAPWFGSHAEVRGAGSWVTDAALARPTYRNFYTPERQDPFIGFRTVGL